MFSLSSSPGHEGCLKPLGREGPPMFMGHSLSLSLSSLSLALSLGVEGGSARGTSGFPDLGCCDAAEEWRWPGVPDLG